MNREDRQNLALITMVVIVALILVAAVIGLSR